MERGFTGFYRVLASFKNVSFLVFMGFARLHRILEAYSSISIGVLRSNQIVMGYLRLETVS